MTQPLPPGPGGGGVGDVADWLRASTLAAHFCDQASDRWERLLEWREAQDAFDDAYERNLARSPSRTVLATLSVTTQWRWKHFHTVHYALTATELSIHPRYTALVAAWSAAVGSNMCSVLNVPPPAGIDIATMESVDTLIEKCRAALTAEEKAGDEDM